METNFKYSELTPELQKQFRDWLRSMLHLGLVNIEFAKTDGTIRQMQCTLQAGAFEPPEKKTKKQPEEVAEKKEKKINDDVCSVWDVEKQSWRSFRFDHIMKIQMETGSNAQ